MPIEFDAAKRTATLETRGLDMARAGEVFAGATLTVGDDRRDYGEDRFITIGFLDGTMVVLVWTPREGVYRIISMRKANERERTLYGPRFRPGRRAGSFQGRLAGEIRQGDGSPGPAADHQAEGVDDDPPVAGRDRSLQGRRSRLADSDRRGASGLDREARRCVTVTRGSIPAYTMRRGHEADRDENVGVDAHASQRPSPPWIGSR